MQKSFLQIFYWAPIHYAAYLNDIPFVRLLCKKGGNVDCRGGLGETALHIAITNDLTEMARVLIELGADVNAQNSIKKVFFFYFFHTTPLHIALKTENLNMIVILMKHNANPSLANKDNQTPLELAESKNRVDIVEVLKGNSPLLQNSEESLAQGSAKERIEDIEDLKSIEIPEQTSPTDPYSRYKNPEKVLKKLGRTSFEELPEHLNYQVLQKLQEQDKFKPKVKEVKSKRLTPAERKKKKWTVTTAGEEQKKMQEMRAKTTQNEAIDTDSLLEEAEQAALKEQEENKLKNQKKKKASTSTSTASVSNQKTSPKKEEEIPKEIEEPPKQPETNQNKEEKQKKVEASKTKTKAKESASPPEPQKKPQPQNRGKKIKKNLKRVQSSSSSSDDENINEDDDDDEIIVMPSFQNKTQQQQQQQKPQQQVQLEQPPQSQPPSSPPQSSIQPNQQISQPQQQPEQSSISLDQLKKLMDGYLSERQTQQQQPPPQYQQPPIQYAYPPGAYVLPPGMPPQIAIPTIPQVPQYNPMNPYMGVGAMPINMKVGGMPQMGKIQQPSAINVTQNEMQKLEARIASLEQIIGPAMRQLQMSPNDVHLGTCQSCKTLNATSVCPRCGIMLCNGCRDIHYNHRCK